MSFHTSCNRMVDIKLLSSLFLLFKKCCFSGPVIGRIINLVPFSMSWDMRKRFRLLWRSNFITFWYSLGLSYGHHKQVLFSVELLIPAIWGHFQWISRVLKPQKPYQFCPWAKNTSKNIDLEEYSGSFFTSSAVNIKHRSLSAIGRIE